jgi:tetratricopeptide (TPR) repeat protein
MLLGLFLASFLLLCDNSHAFGQAKEKGSVTVSRLDTLFSELQNPDNEDWETTERQIWTEWSKSGSRAMDLLYERGVTAMTQGDLPTAVDHFSALIDHAPEFAEGWNKRATVFYMMEEFGLSVADIEQTLVLNPRHFGAMGGLATIMENVGRPEDALQAYENAINIHPNLPGGQDAVDRLKKTVQGTSL